jgi:alkylation response protein AidB-like acyl-CoA dehydrogenase
MAEAAVQADFDWTEEQRSFRDATLEFAELELARDGGVDEAAGFSREAWSKCAAFGIQGLPVPAEYGGIGADATTTILALEALGRGCPDGGLIFSLNAQMWACEMPLVEFGTEAQKRRYLPGLCDGTLIGAHAISEPGAGSDAFSLRTSAVKDGSRWVLNGSKTFVTNGPVADVFVVFATSDPAAGFAGLCVFLVDRETAGLAVGAPLEKMGLRTSPMSEIFLDGCEVPESQLLGRANRGVGVFGSAMEWERGCILAAAVGRMQRQLDRCIAYAQEREQFGQPIGRFQAVAHRIVEMKVRLETARLVLYRFGRLLDRNEATPLDAALTKLHLSESFVSSSLDAVQVHGGYGYMTEYELERDVRDAIGARLYSGTSELQRNVIARHLGL